MKTLNKFNYTLLSFTLIMVLLFSCSSDDDNGVQVLSPDIDYPESQKTVSFMESGEFESPMVEWNGEEGSLQLLNTSLEGISIDQTTGIISYDGSMPLGTTEILISAQNSAGESTQSIVLEHLFDAEMTGGYNFDTNDETDFSSDISINFNSDNTYTQIRNTTTDGVWSREGNLFTLDGNIQLEGELNYDGANAFMTGTWNNLTQEGNFFLELTD